MHFGCKDEATRNEVREGKEKKGKEKKRKGKGRRGKEKSRSYRPIYSRFCAHPFDRRRLFYRSDSEKFGMLKYFTSAFHFFIICLVFYFFIKSFFFILYHFVSFHNRLFLLMRNLFQRS